jgi:4-hydroxy-tetrahydrodipicolinate synthase
MTATPFPGRALFHGSGVALISPFDGEGRLDGDALRAFVAFQVEQGTDALIVNGSTGEAAAMSADEQRRAVELVADGMRGSGRRVPVIAGVGGSDTAVACALARGAREAGADGLLLAPPPYSKPPQRGIVAHFRRVLDAGELPTILYNVPGRTACNLLPATVEELADDERVVGVKEASGDISQIAELARRVGERIALYSGNDDQIVPLLALGGRGVISVLANVAPRDTARIVHAWLEGSIAESRALQLRLLPLIAALFAEANPIPVKAAVGRLGFRVGDPRLPLVPVSDEVAAAVAREMKGLELPGRRG